ncbi:mechanosensitive ion channel [Sphingobacterium sp. DK4209]|uniref:Mechanosensitive ion channel n=1 Tax=Sphingobacterium zhuxiongii TaxID=2662364 RepID=A0A5Q0Q5F8_9SPHI|nr:MULTISPECIES: mechanosensitive ion channel domain-containing protein [unclassified Sphingobacterium]MVZ64966.1 mechanosensitive ion channel [Sphingobacterium sp. DK4209]QGA25305.1 mechanosensitive ion channel [Sphingobacterium sp. dk4302]
MRLPTITLSLSLLFFPLIIRAQTTTIDTKHSDKSLLMEEISNRIEHDSIFYINLMNAFKQLQFNSNENHRGDTLIKAKQASDSFQQAEFKEKIKKLKLSNTAFPVVLHKDTLFYIHTRIGSFLPQERASAISNKIYALYDADNFDPNLLSIEVNAEGRDIIYNQQEHIISVSILDAIWEDKSTDELAQSYVESIRAVIQKEREAYSLFNITKRIGLVILIIVLTSSLLLLINRFFGFTARNIATIKDHIMNGKVFQKVKVLRSNHVEQALIRLNKLLKIIVIFFSVYLSLPLLFSVFPETKAWTSTLIKLISNPLNAILRSFIDYLPNLFRVIVIFFLFKYLVRIARYIFQEIQRENIHFRDFHPEWALPTFKIVQFVCYAFMMVLIFPYLPGSSSPAFKGITVFIGVLVSLGSSNAIANVVAGLVITYMRPFQLGDRVKIGDTVGDVLEKTMLVTRIKTCKNEEITVPNSMVLSSSTINYSNQTKQENKGLIIHYVVTVGYDVPWETVYRLLIVAALASDGIEELPEPFVLQTQLNDFNISYQINAYTRNANVQAAIYSSLLENIQKVFQNVGIELLSPNYHVLNQK